MPTSQIEYNRARGILWLLYGVLTGMLTLISLIDALYNVAIVFGIWTILNFTLSSLFFEKAKENKVSLVIFVITIFLTIVVTLGIFG
jgi:hypothetical protein